MRAKRTIITLAILLAAFLTPALDALAADMGQLRDIERGLPEEAREALEGESLDETLDVSAALNKLLEKGARAFAGIFRASLGTAAAMTAAAMIAACAAPLTPKGEGGVDYVNLVGAAVILTAGVSGARSLIGEASECATQLADLSKLLLPVMASASAVSGAAASGAARYAASALFLSALMSLGQKLILPMIYMYIAAAAGEAAFGGGGLSKLLSTAVTRILTLTALAFTLYLTATGLIASSADAAAVKLTKTAISSLLPVVGGMVSDAADAVASGMGVIRAAAGAVGVVAVLAVCLLPFLKLAVSSALYRAAAMVCETVTPSPLTALIEALGTACSLTLALTGTHAAMLMVSIIAGAKLAGA